MASVTGNPHGPGRAESQRTAAPSDRQRPVQTLARAYQQIMGGANPWVALNEFFHEWLDYSRRQRAALIAEPILQRPAHERPPLELWRWAVFCAAAVEYLCRRDGVPRPPWSEDPAYSLDEPWYAFGDLGGTSLEVRMRLERTTPEPLRRRNVFSGGRVFADKYGVAESRGLRDR